MLPQSRALSVDMVFQGVGEKSHVTKGTLDPRHHPCPTAVQQSRHIFLFRLSHLSLESLLEPPRSCTRSRLHSASRQEHQIESSHVLTAASWNEKPLSVGRTREPPVHFRSKSLQAASCDTPITITTVLLLERINILHNSWCART